MSRTLRLFIRVLVSVLAALVALPATASAAPGPAALVVYVCDKDFDVAQLSDTVTERGPPAAHEFGTTYDADDLRSHGVSVRPDCSVPPVITTYDVPTPFAHIDNATGTTQESAELIDADLSSLQRAGVAAKAVPEAGKTTAVIGRLPDTSVAKGWAGHEVLDIPDWTIAKNDAWVKSVMDRKMPVYVGSNPTWVNIWDAAAGRTTVFGRELQQFTKAGYTWDGWTLVPPGAG